jgi:outer membrane immunogenic protein
MRATAIALAILTGFSAAAAASDIPTKAPPATTPDAYDWTGFYLGANAGGSWGTGTSITTAPSAAFPADFVLSPFPAHGFFGGGQIGGNYQFDSLVIGVEASADLANVKASATTPSPLIANLSSQGSPNFGSFFTTAGRVGIAWHSLLIYGKGGGVWTRISSSSSSFNGAVLTSQSVVFEHPHDGWLLGAGAEWMLDRKWSVKVEYDYIDLTPRFFASVVTFSTTPAQIGTTTVSVGSWKLNSLATGLNYHF